MQQRKRRPRRVSETCPKCGYCDKCGRSNAAPVWPWPIVYPPAYVVPTNTWQYRPYQPTTTLPWHTNVTVSGTSTAAAQPAYIPSVYNLSGLPFDGLKAGDGITLTNIAN